MNKRGIHLVREYCPSCGADYTEEYYRSACKADLCANCQLKEIEKRIKRLDEAVRKFAQQLRDEKYQR